MALPIASLIAEISLPFYGNQFVKHCQDCKSTLFYFRHANDAVTMYNHMLITAERTERKLCNIIKRIKLNVINEVENGVYFLDLIIVRYPDHLEINMF
jgi:hypothetical protein